MNMAWFIVMNTIVLAAALSRIIPFRMFSFIILPAAGGHFHMGQVSNQRNGNMLLRGL